MIGPEMGTCPNRKSILVPTLDVLGERCSFSAGVAKHKESLSKNKASIEES